jgi:hypothetical protein
MFKKFNSQCNGAGEVGGMDKKTKTKKPAAPGDEPNKQVSRREFLKEVAKATLIGGAVAAAGSTGIEVGPEIAAASDIFALQRPNVIISLINESEVMSEREAASLVAVLNTQVRRDFGPAWGVEAEVKAVPKGSAPEKGSWWLVIADTSDVASALGYHETTEEGMPLGKVFAKDSEKDGSPVSLVASHELLEMLADPWINLTILQSNSPNNPHISNTGILYAREVCDACESPKFGYSIDGKLVSDFVLPSWFQSPAPQGVTKFDFMGYVKEPLGLLEGGYIGVMYIQTGEWTTLEAAGAQAAKHVNFESRMERRKKPRDQWKPSAVDFRRRN